MHKLYLFLSELLKKLNNFYFIIPIIMFTNWQVNDDSIGTAIVVDSYGKMSRAISLLDMSVIMMTIEIVLS